MSQLCEPVNYFALALDPIHVGTGGYRLGRVDLGIVREPGTNLPKIPGSSLSGTARAYAAAATGRYVWRGNGGEGSCAGQGQADEETGRLGHCGKPHCPVCVAFGFARRDAGFRGLAQFSDARLLFFPVHSMVGPVWITSPGLLAEHGIQESTPGDAVRPAKALRLGGKRLNLGWLMLPTADELEVPSDWPVVAKELEPVRQRMVLVPEKLFSRLVNDNLEVRTSVSIDPSTGAAESGALYSYEALARASVVWFQVTYSAPDLFRIRRDGESVVPEPREGAEVDGKAYPSVRFVVERGLSALEHLGLGGMNTRGMGRLRVLNLDCVRDGGGIVAGVRVRNQGGGE